MTTDHFLLNGQAAAPIKPRRLHCGPVSLLYAHGRLKNISAGGALLLSEIYAAVRNANWDTIAGVMHDEQIEQRDEGFTITFRSEHQRDDINFGWMGEIHGDTDGTITFQFHGQARSTFARNRIGFCVLHPMTAAGAACRIDHIDGTVTTAHLPTTISPHQPFLNIRSIHHQIAPALWVEVRMEGDSYEMEDQRQWTDASFKTYCTPLSHPFPVIVPAGTRVDQRITLRLHGEVPHVAAAAAGSPPLTITVTTEEHPLPAIGLGMAEHREPHSERANRLLRALHLTHLRVDVRPHKADWRQVLTRAVTDAAALSCGLELAVHLSEGAEDAELTALRDTLLENLNEHKVSLARVLIFHRQQKATTAQWVTLARRHLQGMEAPIGGGTDAFFTELNRSRPQAAAFDVVCYSCNPQVHAFDDASLVETLAVLPVTVSTAESFSAGKAIAITPITFKMRWNPNATADLPPVEGELPATVDPRQLSLFGAAWTLGTLKYLAASSVHSLTYFQTTGWRGVMERESSLSLPAKFPSTAGQVFPLYHVLADVAEFRGGTAVTCISSDPQTVEALLLARQDRHRLMLANFTGDAQQVEVRGIPAGDYAQRRLDAQSAAVATRDPETFRRQTSTSIAAPDGTISLTLPAYGLITLDGKTAE